MQKSGVGCCERAAGELSISMQSAQHDEAASECMCRHLGGHHVQCLADLDQHAHQANDLELDAVIARMLHAATAYNLQLIDVSATRAYTRLSTTAAGHPALRRHLTGGGVAGFFPGAALRLIVTAPVSP